MITPCSSDTVLRYLSGIGCLLDRWDASPVSDQLDERLLVILSCPLRDEEGTKYLVEEVAACDLDTWYCGRYC